MTYVTAIIEKGADPDLIRGIIENGKGVLKVTITTDIKEEDTPLINKKEEVLSPEKKEWLKKLEKLYNNVERGTADLTDERTRYILQ